MTRPCFCLAIIALLLTACVEQSPAPVVATDGSPVPSVVTADAPPVEETPAQTGESPSQTDEAPIRTDELETPEHAIGLLLPLDDARPQQRRLAATLRNAAELALEDLGETGLRLIVQDTTTDPATAARQAIVEGATILVGPLYADAVRTAGEVAVGEGIGMIAFSTDSTVAQPGVYLIGSLPEQEVERIITYAINNGHRQFGALVPETSYGDLAHGRLVEGLAGFGEAEPLVVRYDATFESQTQAAERFAAEHIARVNADPANAVTAVLLPASDNELLTLSSFLAEQEVSREVVRLLGTGLWDARAALRDESLLGGWFAAPTPRFRDTFAERYRVRFDATPPALAALAYDAVAVAGTLALAGGADPFSADAITDAAGFHGVTGTFRFLPDGLNERELAILEVERDGFRVIDPARRRFTGF